MQSVDDVNRGNLKIPGNLQLLPHLQLSDFMNDSLKSRLILYVSVTTELQLQVYSTSSDCSQMH